MSLKTDICNLNIDYNIYYLRSGGITMITRIQKIYLAVGLNFIGLYYLLHYYSSMSLVLGIFAILISLSNIYDCDIKKVSLIFFGQLVIGFISHIFLVYNCAIILVIANTLICASFQDVYTHSSKKTKNSLGKMVILLFKALMVIFVLWTLIPLTIIASDGDIKAFDEFNMLILIGIIFVPIIWEYVSLKYKGDINDKFIGKIVCKR